MKLPSLNPIKIIKKIKRRINGENISPYWLSPFKEKDLKTIPSDWRFGPPDYIGIGTSKAGTSWWHQLLLEHPQVQENRLGFKELDYFMHFLYDGLTPEAIRVYQQAFAAPQGAICGEYTPGYLRTPFSAEYIHKSAPKAKLIVIVRNPIDQTSSGTNQLMQTASYYNLTGNRLKVYQNIAVNPNVIMYNLVSSALKTYLNYFDRSQILLLQYEKCTQDPLFEIRRTYYFLGIDEKFSPPSLHREINKIDYRIPKIHSSQRTRFADFFRDDVENLVQLFPEIDLSLWSDF